MNKNSVIMVWKEPKTRRHYAVGEIEKTKDGFTFQYTHEVIDALKKGFELLLPFPEIEKEYNSEVLFPVFSTRLPDKKRPDIEDILKKYGIKEYDPFELLKHGAKLPTDNLRFEKKITDISELDNFKFCLAGARHYLGCEDRTCEKNELIKSPRGEITLVQENDNEFDDKAIRAEYAGKIVGYIPRYYTKVINSALDKGIDIHCYLLDVKLCRDCDNCVEVKMKIN